MISPNWLFPIQQNINQIMLQIIYPDFSKKGQPLSNLTLIIQGLQTIAEN